MEIKKKRGFNFTNSEITLLMQCVVPQLNVIENKKTDGASLREKNKTWQNVTSSFNSLSDADSHRDIHSIKTKYENIKRTLKKKIAVNKQNLNKIDGGSTNEINLLWYEEELLSILQLGIEGHDSHSDNFPEMSVDSYTEISPNEILNLVEVIDNSEVQSQNKGNEVDTKSNEDFQLSKNKVRSIPKTNKTSLCNRWNLKRKRKNFTDEYKKTSFDLFQRLTQGKTDLNEVKKKCFQVELKHKYEDAAQKLEEWSLKKKILEIDLHLKMESLAELSRESDRKQQLFELMIEKEKITIESMKCELNMKLKKNQDH